ncbi:hypothetical protein [Ruegeria sp.]|uniref:hypothetical protein n=1 Tax=Ruegeria sp. TaxID=1879320 RepID=UPI003C7C0A17
MNANRLINMILRQVMRRFVTRGIGAGMNRAGRSGQNPERGQNKPRNPGAAQQQKSMKQAQQITRQMRRFMRF